MTTFPRLILSALLVAGIISAFVLPQQPDAQHQPLPQFEKTTNFLLEVAKGNVPGHATIAKFGENSDIDALSGFETIWDGDGIYVPPTQARIHTVASTDADDDGTEVSTGTATGGSRTTIIDAAATFVTDTVAAGDLVLNDTTVELCFVTAVTSETVLTCAGSMRDPNTGDVGLSNQFGDTYRVVTDTSTGASVLHILGLNALRLRTEEFVMLDGGGANAVSTANSYVRQFRGRVFASASTGAEGVVTSTAAVDATVTLQVIDGNNQTLMTPYTCPANKICYITRWWGSISKQVATSTSDMHLRGGVLDGISYLLQTRAISTTGNSSFDYPYAVPISLPGGFDIWVEADASANDTAVASGFDIIVVDN